MVGRRVTWSDGYVRQWQLPTSLLGGASDAACSSPTTVADPGRVRALCADHDAPVVRPLALNVPSSETVLVVRAEDAEAQSQASAGTIRTRRDGRSTDPCEKSSYATGKHAGVIYCARGV